MTYRLRPLVVVGLLAMPSGCRMNDCNAKSFHAFGLENAKDAYAQWNRYKHILVVRADEDRWEGRNPPDYSFYHFKATVIRIYKGDWKVSDRVSIKEQKEAPAAPAYSGYAGRLSVIF